MVFRLTVKGWSPDVEYPPITHTFCGDTEEEVCALFEKHLLGDQMLRELVAADAVTFCWDCCDACELAEPEVPLPPPGPPTAVPPGQRVPIRPEPKHPPTRPRAVAVPETRIRPTLPGVAPTRRPQIRPIGPAPSRRAVAARPGLAEAAYTGRRPMLRAKLPPAR